MARPRRLEVSAILDMPSWAALLGLIAEFPVLHAALRALHTPGTHSVRASDFEFISKNTQMSAIGEFFDLLPETLS